MYIVHCIHYFIIVMQSFLIRKHTAPLICYFSEQVREVPFIFLIIPYNNGIY